MLTWLCFDGRAASGATPLSGSTALNLNQRPSSPGACVQRAGLRFCCAVVESGTVKLVAAGKEGHGGGMGKDIHVRSPSLNPLHSPCQTHTLPYASYGQVRLLRLAQSLRTRVLALPAAGHPGVGPDQGGLLEGGWREGRWAGPVAGPGIGRGGCCHHPQFPQGCRRMFCGTTRQRQDLYAS